MHIKTRMDLIMDGLMVSKVALQHILSDTNRPHGRVVTTESIIRAEIALEKIEKAYEAVNGTEERPGT